MTGPANRGQQNYMCDQVLLSLNQPNTVADNIYWVAWTWYHCSVWSQWRNEEEGEEPDSQA